MGVTSLLMTSVVLRLPMVPVAESAICARLLDAHPASSPDRASKRKETGEVRRTNPVAHKPRQKIHNVDSPTNTRSLSPSIFAAQAIDIASEHITGGSGSLGNQLLNSALSSSICQPPRIAASKQRHGPSLDLSLRMKSKADRMSLHRQPRANACPPS